MIIYILPANIVGNTANNNCVEVTLRITRIKFEDPIDVDIFNNENYNGEPYFKIWINGHFFMDDNPVFMDEKDRFINQSFSLDILDNDDTVDIIIELWDEDVAEDDMLDISKNGTDCDLTYYISTNTWNGDTISNISSGNDDGSITIDEDDATIEFSLFDNEKKSEMSIEEKTMLANKFAPILFFKENEEFFPIEINAMLQHSDLKSVENNSILDSMPITIDSLFLHSDYKPKNPRYYIDFHEGDSVNKIKDTYEIIKDKYNSTIYSHVSSTSDGEIIIQYWFFFIFNNGKYNDHEGDWEMIQIILDSNETPSFSGYSQHYTGRARHWSKTFTEDSQPVVYIAQGSHASYFDNGNNGYHSLELEGCGLTGDEYTGDTIKYSPFKDYSLVLLNDQKWLHFDGYWGKKTDSESTTGPQGPYYRHCGCNKYMWTNPMEWYDHLPEDNLDDRTPNKKPTASPSANITYGNTPLSVSFIGSGSDPDGTIVTYRWDFENGSVSSEQNPNYLFQNPRVYNVTLTVIDNYGATGTETITITVTQIGDNEEPLLDNEDNKQSKLSEILIISIGIIIAIILIILFWISKKRSKKKQ